MKTWIKRTLIGLLTTGAIFGGLGAWAHNHHRGWGAMSDEEAGMAKAYIVKRIGSRLDLDAGQQAKLGTLADAMHEQRKALVGSTTDPRREMGSLIDGAQFDRTRATALIDAKVVAVREKSPAVVGAMADFYDSLRPEQQTKVRSMLAERGHGHDDEHRR